MAEKRTQNGRDTTTGRFLPGNPGGGRPPMPEELKALYQANAAEALDIARKLMRSAKQPGTVRLRACEFITERGYGKAMQPIDANIQVQNTPDAELLAEAAEIVKRTKEAK